MTDLSSRQGGHLTTNKTAAVLTTDKIWSWVPEGLNAKKKWLTDWLTYQQLQSNSITLADKKDKVAPVLN